MAFTLKDAENLALLRAYVVTIEKKTMELWANDKNGDCMDGAIAAIKDLLTVLTDLQTNCIAASGEPDCRDGYEPCNDGVCRVWCS